MESTLAEVLILNRLGVGEFYLMVIYAELQNLGNLEGPLGGGA